jgi:hypothetical protein
VSHLREGGCNESILKRWLGHSNGSDITNRYDKSAENISARRNWVESIGTGLNVADALLREQGDPPPPVGSNSNRRSFKPATPLAPVETVVPYQASDDDLPAELFEPPTEALAEFK